MGWGKLLIKRIFMKGLKIYHVEIFHLKTNLNKSELIERFEQNISIDNSIIPKRYTQKPNKLYEGLIVENEFKIQHKWIYGENGSWRPSISGIIDDYSIEFEFRLPNISIFILTSFLFLSIIAITISAYYIITEGKFEWITSLPIIFILVIFPASINGYKKERVKAKHDLRKLFS